MGFVKKFLKGIAVLAGVLILIILGFVGNALLNFDKTCDHPLPAVEVSKDPAVLKRGAYLVNGPAHCVLCHVGGVEDGMKAMAGEEVDLKGGYKFVMGPLGTMYTSNLTQDKETGLGRYSDGHVARMMRHNIRPNGQTSVGPMMPFGNMAEDDLNAVISYLKSRPAVKNEVPRNSFTVLGKVIRTYTAIFKPRFDIKPAKTAPDEAPTKERGEYLARYVTNCEGCHTPRNPMTFAATGPEFSGGMEMEPADLPGVDPKVWYRSENITPAPGAGLLKFPDADAWVARFRAGRQKAGSVMPWEQFSRMSDADLRALYAFLASLAPIHKDPIVTEFRKD